MVIFIGIIAAVSIIAFVVWLLRTSPAQTQRDINKIVPVDKFERHTKEVERQRKRWQGRRRK